MSRATAIDIEHTVSARQWRQTIQLVGGWIAAFVVLLAALHTLGISATAITGRMDRLWRIAGGMLRPASGGAFAELLGALAESIGMAFLGTFLASIAASVFSMLGAKNINSLPWLRLPVRRCFDVIRGIDSLVWALIFVRAVGMGPLAGVLAIAASDTGTLSKLNADAIESTQKRQAEGVRAAGGHGLHVVRFGIIPQVIPAMLSNALYMFESNVRSATILGIVGAGGIGFQLSDRIRAHRWGEVSFIILMIIAAVFVIDQLSRVIRRRFIQAGVQNTVI